MFNPMMMLNSMIQNNPQLAQYWNMAQQMTNGKNPQEIQKVAENLAQQRGIDLSQVEQVVKQFMGGQK